VLRVDSADPDARERFRREIDFEARLVHPHIIPVIESGEVDGALYFVMPYVEGSTLRELLTQSGPLPIADALRITRQICEGLAHAHERQIVHRDIKPANILLASGNAMIADFGIARALDSADIGAWTTGTGLRLGTPAYMSPEQSAGDPELDHRSDLYSLGCVLFEMLVGQPPFAAAAYATVLGQHAVTPAPSVRSRRPEVPPRLDSLVTRLLAKQPAERFQSTRELIAAIDAALAELQAPPAEEPTWRRSRIALAAVVALAVVGTIALTSSASRLAAHRDSLADTSRIVLYPLEGDPSEREAATELLRRAFARWEGVALVDAFQVHDAIGDRPLSSRRAGSVARDLGAGRFIRGSVVRTDAGLELRAVFSSAGRRPVTLAEYTERLPAGTWVSRDSIAARAVTRLLFREEAPRDIDVGATSTRRVAAVQHYLAGRRAVADWQLDSAWQLDQSFREAALWLALVRFWRNARPANWLLPAQTVAQAAPATNDAFSRRHANALLALANDARPQACAEWDALTSIAPLEFSGWYSAALCRDRDPEVLSDPAAPTGWRFRSSAHTAQMQYLRAFQQLPSVHRALRDRAYERVRLLLYLSETAMRFGRVSASGATMHAFPILNGDTLVLAPVPPALISGADTGMLRLKRRTSARVVRQQRELFRDITSVWVSADPASADAREAQALALQMLGEPSALDSMVRARTLAVTDEQRRRLAATEVWMRVRLGVPDDARGLRQARLLTDSLIRTLPAGSEDQSIMAVAALMGHLRRIPARTDTLPIAGAQPGTEGRARLDAAVLALNLDAATGASQASIARRAYRVDSLVGLVLPAAAQASARSGAFSRAAALGYPVARIPLSLLEPIRDDYLVDLILAATRRDTSALRAGMRSLQFMRRTSSRPELVTFDALVAEAALLVEDRDAALAAEWLDAALRTQRQSVPDFDPVNAIAFVRAMRLRAEIATAMGDTETAARWRRAMQELWGSADPSVAALLERPTLASR